MIGNTETGTFSPDVDRYELTRDSMYVRQMKEAWTGFNRTNGMGTDWKQNDYNDDIEWWIISASRAYMLTKDTAYSNTAKKNFEWLYSTQWDMTLGGGIWWKNNERGGKHACSNGPASYAAMNLYAIYNDTSYLNKAKATYKWERAALFNPNTGAVADNMRANGQVGSVAPATGLESSSTSGGVAILTLTVLATQPAGIAIKRKNIVLRNFEPKAGEMFSINGSKVPGHGNGKSMLLLQRGSDGGVTRTVLLR
jgi:hypothetical protein